MTPEHAIVLGKRGFRFGKACFLLSIRGGFAAGRPACNSRISLENQGYRQKFPLMDHTVVGPLKSPARSPLFAYTVGH